MDCFECLMLFKAIRVYIFYMIWRPSHEMSTRNVCNYVRIQKNQYCEFFLSIYNFLNERANTAASGFHLFMSLFGKCDDFLQLAVFSH